MIHTNAFLVRFRYWVRVGSRVRLTGGTQLTHPLTSYTSRSSAAQRVSPEAMMLHKQQKTINEILERLTPRGSECESSEAAGSYDAGGDGAGDESV